MRKTLFRKRLLLVVTIVILFTSLFSACQPSERRARQHYEEGLSHKSRHAYQEAIRHFRLALDENPGHVESYIELGILFSRKKDYRQALKYFEAAGRQGAESFTLSALNGYAFEELGELPQAEHYYEQALGQAPRLTDVRLRLANILEWQDRVMEAAELLRQALEINPTIEHAEQLKTRVEILTRSEGPQLHLALADLYLRQGKIRRGTAEYHKAVDFASDTPEGLVQFGRFCLERAQFNAALDSFQQARQQGARLDFQLSADIAVSHEKLGQLEAAVQEYRRALALKPQQAVIHLKIAELSKELGKHIEAADQLEQLFRVSLHTPQLQLGSGVFPTANQLWEEILALRGENSSKTVCYQEFPEQAPIVPVMVDQKTLVPMRAEESLAYTILSDRLTQFLGIRVTARTSEVRFNIYGRVESAALVTISSLKVGELEARNIPVLIGDLSRYPGIDGFLGNNFLKHFHLEINDEDHLFILTKLHS
ncbi:MAG: tetratricopeptide repeat protein [bacterium]|nr:tetratricopeptide repeat protein [bacterium]